MKAKDQLGREGEQHAAEHLKQCGYDVVARNWRGDGGELDIIAVRGCELAIVEVKTRRTSVFGDPLSAIDAPKLARMWRLGTQWSRANPERARGLILTLHAIGIIGAGADAELTHLADLR